MGSYYWSAEATDPAELFGGEWEAVKDTFVWAKGDAEEVGSKGGARTVALTVAQMPAHTHTGPSHTHAGPSHYHIQRGFRNSSREAGGTALGLASAAKTEVSFGGRVLVDTKAATDQAYTQVGAVNTGNSGTGQTGASGTQATSSTGDNAAHDNMPPYVAAYCWKRTA